MNKILPITLPAASQQLSSLENLMHGITGEATVGSALLELDDFSVTFGSKTVLSKISFTVSEKGIVVLTGPKGTERTILLRTLAGFGAASFSYQTAGTAVYHGAELGEKEHPELVAQNAELMMASVLKNVVTNLPERHKLTQPLQRELAQKLLAEAGLQELCDRLDETMFSLPLALQRHLSILRAIVLNPPLLCIDEPTAGLSDLEAARLIAYLRKEATQRALLIAVHNQTHARLLGGDAVFVAYGRMLEQQPIPQIFDNPRTVAAIEFAQTGKCSVASYEASLQAPVFVKNSPAAISSEMQTDAKLAAVEVKAENQTPQVKLPVELQVELGKFMWLKRGMLAGTPAPGALSDMHSDLSALRAHGVTTIMSLTETGLDESALQPFGLKTEWEPIPDKEAPTIAQGIRICKELESLLELGEVVAIQSDAGLGRTGTILAAHLLWKGMRLQDALEYVRRVEPRWVQTRAQEDFLHEFAQRV
jgi:atypical dual specificity phosphatase